MTVQLKLVGKVDAIDSGVRNVLHSAPVRSLLQSQAERAAASCNALMSPRLRKGSKGYAGHTVERNWLSAGIVYTTDYKTQLDNARHNTLKKGTGA